MVNKPKAIGTAGETGVVRFAREHGFGLADRLTMKGRDDEGDVALCPGVIVEVKAGAKAHKASAEQVAEWLAETTIERQNSGADIGLLVVAKRGYAPSRAGHWRAFLPEAWRLFAPIGRTTADGYLVARHVQRVLACPIEMSYADAILALRRAGWGDPLD